MSSVKSQQGFIHLLPILLIAVVVLVGTFIILSNKTNLPTPLQDALRPFNLGTKNTSVAPKTEYQNPLDTKSQYTNPFSGYKNPFEALK